MTGKPPLKKEIRIVNVGETDALIKGFIVVAAFVCLGAVYYLNSTNPPGEPDIPTDLIAGLLGAIVAYYFQRKPEKIQ